MEMTGIALKAKRVFTVENLLNQSEYADIAEELAEILNAAEKGR